MNADRMSEALYGASGSETRSGALAEAVDAFFDRGAEALPTYVSRARAMRVSLLVALIVLVVGLKTVLYEKNKYERSDNAVKKFRWVLMLGILLSICRQLQEFLADYIYMATNIKLNHQHFTNVYWLRKYCDAFRGV